MRTLVVGAGIAGLTLGGLLCRQERPPVIVERSASPADGYAIGLYPLGSCVLHGLGAYRELAARSLVLKRYELSAGSGRMLQSLNMSVLTGAVGPLLMVSRGDLGPAYRWPMSDVRARRWVRGRVALCGDAAAGFLPAAGVGASAAMRAGAGLADELSRADASTVPLALQLYQKRRRGFVERSQAESRRLARAMFVTSPLLAWARDHVARRFPAERALGHIIGSAHKPF